MRGKAKEEGNEAAASYDAGSCFTKPGMVVEIAPATVGGRQAAPNMPAAFGLRRAAPVLPPLCADGYSVPRLAPCRAAFEASALLTPITAV